MTTVSTGHIGSAGTLEDKTAFVDEILAQLGMESTAWRVEFLLTWMRGESTAALYNPFATTQNVPEADRGNPYFFNHNGGFPVKNYANVEAGVRATVKTMTNPYYPDIMNSLRQQKIVNLSKVLKQFKTWSSTDHYYIATMLRQGWRPQGRDIPDQKPREKVIGAKTNPVTKKTVEKSVRDAGITAAAAAGIPAVFSLIQQGDLNWSPILGALNEGNWHLVLALGLPLVYRIVRAYMGRAPIDEIS